MRNCSRDKRESEILGVLGVWQHVPPTANADELSFAHEADPLRPEIRDKRQLRNLRTSVKRFRAEALDPSMKVGNVRFYKQFKQLC